MKTVMSGDIKPKKPERIPPTLTLNEDDLPDIKDWKVGGKYTVTLQVEQTSSSKGDMIGDGSKKLEARFKVLSASAGEEPMEEETPEEEKEPEEEMPEEENYGEEGDMEDMPKGGGPHIAIIVRAVKKKLGV